MNRNQRRTVDKVVDGDTFRVKRKVNGSHFVRITGIDTPEKGERGYYAAKQGLQQVLGRGPVTVRPVGKSYGRVVAKVTVQRRDVSRSMRRKGY